MRSHLQIDAPDIEVTDFAGLEIQWDRRVLRPRPWTAEQGRWAADILADVPEGPILELCCGAGHIGLVAARASDRDLVQVDGDPVAAAYARRNAAAAGISSDVRHAGLDVAVEDGERFPMVLADPPWLPTAGIVAYPDDPPHAVDGGVDGDDVLLECLAVAVEHLAPGGHLVVQVGLPQQIERVEEWLAGHAADGSDGGPGPLAVVGVRDRRPGGFLVHVGPPGGGA
ncbi:MAG TPA: methyltransferase [Nocardioides sp.]|nr:methyltransferase [Nocardioides sp.]